MGGRVLLLHRWDEFKPLLQALPAAPQLPQLKLPPFRAPVLDTEVPFLEPEYLPHPGHSFGLKETINLKSVFGDAVLDRLVGIARDTGLWYLMVPEKFGGLGLPMLSQIAILEQFYYTAVPFPFANVPNILYECQGDQIEKFLKPVVEGRMTTCFAQTEPNAGSDPGGMMQTRAVQKGRNWVLNGTKMWISMAAESDLMLVQAVTDPDQRQRGGQGSRTARAG